MKGGGEHGLPMALEQAAWGSFPTLALLSSFIGTPKSCSLVRTGSKRSRAGAITKKPLEYRGIYRAAGSRVRDALVRMSSVMFIGTGLSDCESCQSGRYVGENNEGRVHWNSWRCV